MPLCCNLLIYYRLFIWVHYESAKRQVVKNFKFRLQVILNMKEKLLEEKLLELARVQRGLQDARERQLKLENYQAEITEALMNVYRSGNELNLVEVQRYKNFINKLIVDISNQKVVINNIGKLLASKQREVNEILKEKKVLEKLKEKQQKTFYLDFERNERKELDDITSSRYAIA